MIPVPAAPPRLTRALALCAVAVTPLVVWPGLERPFSTPKIWLLAGVSLALLLGTWRAGPPLERRSGCAAALRALPLAWLLPWIASSWLGEVVSLDALMLGLGGALWALALVSSGARRRDVMTAHVAAASFVAGLAALQWAGQDPFPALGWAPTIEGASPRLRVYSTLGNPNFVAALLSASIPYTVRLATSAPRMTGAGAGWLALALQVAAVAATGSRAGALGLVAAAAAGFLSLARRARLLVMAAGIAVAAIVVAMSGARPIGETTAGRLYIWRATWVHALDRPWVGHGPGGFEVFYPRWEREWRRGPSPRGATFPGPQQHAHNDYIEALVERGLPGLASLAGVLSIALLCAGRRARQGDADAAAVAGALAALAAIALVDFPWARPAEVALVWTSVAVLRLGSEDKPRLQAFE